MSDANLNLIISLALMLIAVASVWKDVYTNKPPRKFFRRFTPVGRLLLLASIVFIFINYFKDINTERKVSVAEIAKNKADLASEAIQKQLTQSQEKLKESQDSLYNLQMSARETILQRVDSSYTKSLKASNEALAKYHIKIIDSLHTVVGTLKLNASNPQFSLAPVTDNAQPVYLTRLGSDTLKIKFVSANGTSYHIQLQAYFILQTGKGDILLEKEVLGVGQSFINSDVTSTIMCPVNQSLLSLPKILIVLYGSFTKDPYGQQVIPFLQSFEFNFVDNTFLGQREIAIGSFKKNMGLK